MIDPQQQQSTNSSPIPNPPSVGRASLPATPPAIVTPDCRGVWFDGYRRRLPHFRLEGATYFVTWRLSPGQCDLTPDERSLVQSAIRHFEAQRYHLLAWVVMNDHCHVLVQPFDDWTLERILHTWKSFTTNRLQRAYERLRCVWQDESFDRIVRDEEEFFEKMHYLLNNPMKRWPELKHYEWVGVHEQFRNLLAHEGGQGRPPH